MKKLLFCLAASSVLFACDKGDDNNGTTTETKKIPSKATIVYDNRDGVYVDAYTYDDQNRLIKISWIEPQEADNSSVEITYGSDNKPTKLTWCYNDANRSPYEETVSYSGNIVQMTSEQYGSSFAKINSNGQVLQYWDEGDEDTTRYFYNANGNINKITWGEGDDDQTTISYSDTKAMFRHVNAPEWLINYLFDVYQAKSGYMPSKIEDSWELDTFAYVLENDYVKTRTAVYVEKDEIAKKHRTKRAKRVATKAVEGTTETTTFEYVNAK